MTLHDREMRKPPAWPRGVVLAGVALAALGLPRTARAQQWTLVWSDEFNGASGAAPDPAKWRYDTGGGGWGNNELQVYCAPGSNTAPCSATPNGAPSGRTTPRTR